MSFAAAPPQDLLGAHAAQTGVAPGMSPLSELGGGLWPVFAELMQTLEAARPSGEVLPQGGSFLPSARAAAPFEDSLEAAAPAFLPTLIAVALDGAEPMRSAPPAGAWPAQALPALSSGVASPPQTLGASPAIDGELPAAPSVLATRAGTVEASSTRATTASDFGPDVLATRNLSSMTSAPAAGRAVVVEAVAREGAEIAKPSIPGGALDVEPMSRPSAISLERPQGIGNDTPPRAALSVGPASAPEALAVAESSAPDGAVPPTLATSAVTPTSGSQGAPLPSPEPVEGVDEGPIDVKSHDALAGRIRWLVDNHVNEARLKLNPPELGTIDVKISIVEDKTFVQLSASSVTARDELQQGLPRLRELLNVSGLELGGATVTGGREQGSGGEPPPFFHAAARVYRADHAAAPETQPALSAGGRERASQIDLYA